MLLKTTIVLITKGVSFMSNSIQKNLETAGYEVIRAEPDIESLTACKDRSDLFLFYLGNFVLDISETLVYLKDLCLEKDKRLILIGNEAELKAANVHIPDGAVAQKFQRPFDLKKLTSEVGRFATEVNYRELKKSILLVDDDPTFLKMVKGWLDESYRVTIVTSGTQALMFIADNKPDLILLDYEMPVTSGPQVLEMIRSETGVNGVDKIPVIFLTGKGDRESVMKVLSLKPEGYLLKSLSRDQILKSVDDFFAKRRVEQINEKAQLK